MELFSQRALRTPLTIKTLILVWWGRYKERKAAEPIPMKFHKGVYRPWGTVQKVQHYGWRLTQVWLVYMAVLLAALAYTKLVGPIF